MSTWTAPATFTSGAALTAAQLNATRDNLTFLKGTLDLLTNSTSADTGTTMYLSLTRATSTATTFQSFVTADTFARHYVDVAGKHWWGTGAATADVSLFKNAASMQIDGPTDFSLFVNGGLLIGPDNGGAGAAGRFIQLSERVDTPLASADKVLMYARDNGAGKTQIVAMFSTGSAVVIATQV